MTSDRVCRVAKVARSMMGLRKPRRLALTCLLATVGVAGCGIAPAIGLQSRQGASRANSAAKMVDAPHWVKEAIFYQVFPERFENGKSDNDPPGTEPWGSKPTNDNMMGGDLAGIHQRLGYLQELGVTALYLNPIFASPSNHKYNTTDYLRIDPHFGTLQDFRALVKDLKRRKMRLILDGVFNHTGDTHWAFEEASASGMVSPFWTWYKIYSYPVVYKPKPNYDAWWGFGSLPKLNYENPVVPKYVLDKVVDFWTREGIDGWRLDVPNEISSPTFWSAFREKVRSINPEAYLVGEIWDDPIAWLHGDKFDATMNYPLRSEVLAFVAERKRNVDDFDDHLANQRRSQGTAANGMFNLLGSHDTERLRTLVGQDAKRHRVSALLQFTYPGAPVIYYGDEVGMIGEKDPDDRRCFDWTGATWDRETLEYYRSLIAIRKEHRALRDGTFQTLRRHNDLGLYCYYRNWLGTDRVVVVVNNGSTVQARVSVPLKDTAIADGTGFIDLLKGSRYQAENDQVEVSDVGPNGAILLASSERPALLRSEPASYPRHGIKARKRSSKTLAK